MQFLECLDCKIQADDVAFRKKGKGFARPNTGARCDACVLKQQIFRRDPANQYLIDRQPSTIAKKAIRQEKLDEQSKERAKEQRKKARVAAAAAKQQRIEQDRIAEAIAKKQAEEDMETYIKLIQDTIVAKYCEENPDFTPGVARNGYAF
jgi:hypothetical protein